MYVYVRVYVLYTQMNIQHISLSAQIAPLPIFFGKDIENMFNIQMDDNKKNNKKSNNNKSKTTLTITTTAIQHTTAKNLWKAKQE